MTTPTERQKRFEEKFYRGDFGWHEHQVGGREPMVKDTELLLAHMESEVEKAVRKAKREVAHDIKLRIEQHEADEDHRDGTAQMPPKYQVLEDYIDDIYLTPSNPTDHD